MSTLGKPFDVDHSTDLPLTKLVVAGKPRTIASRLEKP